MSHDIVVSGSAHEVDEIPHEYTLYRKVKDPRTAASPGDCTLLMIDIGQYRLTNISQNAKKLDKKTNADRFTLFECLTLLIVG